MITKKEKKPTSKGKVLNQRQLIFCKNYLVNGFNASKAAVDAGYSPATYYKTSVKLMRNPLVREYLKKRMAAVEKELDITFEKKMDLLWKAANRCYGATDEEVENLKKGLLFEPPFKFDPGSMVNLVNELNKMQGHHATPKTITLNVDADAAEVDEHIKKFEREY